MIMQIILHIQQCIEIDIYFATVILVQLLEQFRS